MVVCRRPTMFARVKSSSSSAKKSGADMDRADIGAIQDSFGQPVLARKRTGRTFMGDNLRHVDDRSQAVFPRDDGKGGDAFQIQNSPLA